MAIEGLCVRPESSTTSLSYARFKAGEPDISEAVGVTLEAYKTLGFTPDEDQARESLTDNFKLVGELGHDGRLYVEPPQGVSFDMIIAAADSKRPDGVEEAYRWPALWIPNTQDNSYTTEELDAAAEKPEARLAVFNADEKTEVDPLLHFLEQPYDDKYRKTGQQTQLEALEATKEFVANAAYHEQVRAQALSHRAAALMVLMDRIRGIDANSEDFVLNRGWMRVPELGRRVVGGGSYVGDVVSGGGQSEFVGSFGGADWDEGVGVSVGPKASESQTS